MIMIKVADDLAIPVIPSRSILSQISGWLRQMITDLFCSDKPFDQTSFDMLRGNILNGNQWNMINFNTCRDKQSHAQLSLRWNYLTIPKVSSPHFWLWYN